MREPPPVPAQDPLPKEGLILPKAMQATGGTALSPAKTPSPLHGGTPLFGHGYQEAAVVLGRGLAPVPAPEGSQR